jgi:lipopolysaccharide transport system ATP-binding protein
MSTVIQVDKLSKCYRLGAIGGSTLRADVSRWLAKLRGRPDPNLIIGQEHHARLMGQEFWALQDVSFEVKQGEILGVIGRNGAGKSTLLKILSRVTAPTSGDVRINGRVASLLEVGTGFHPELSGRENIFLNGAILGMTRMEVRRKFDEIVAFSGVEDFVDTPVKRYSSGMYVRLAFAIAAHLEPEILIVDEVLAVGDLAFQQKCLGKMSEVSNSGRTILFVSHNMAIIERLCRRTMVLHAGRLEYFGDTDDAIKHYMSELIIPGESEGHIFDLAKASHRRSNIGQFLQRMELYTDDEVPVLEGIRIGASLKVKIYFDLPTPTRSFDMGLAFDDMYNQRIFTAHSLFEPARHNGEIVGPQVFVCEIPSLTFTPGIYNLRIWMDINHVEADFINPVARLTVLESDYYGTGKAPWNGILVLEHHWYLEQPSRVSI